MDHREQLAKTTGAAVEALVPAPAVQAPRPSRIALSREQCLELENIRLKAIMAQNDLARLEEARVAWTKRLEAEHGVSIQGWMINIEQGVAVDPNAAQAAAS